jgi:hypothetical protein
MASFLPLDGFFVFLGVRLPLSVLGVGAGSSAELHPTATATASRTEGLYNSNKYTVCV